MVSLGLNQSPGMVKYMVHQITEFILINLYCQRKMILGGSMKTMNFIVLPYNIKILNLWNTIQSLFLKL